MVNLVKSVSATTVELYNFNYGPVELNKNTISMNKKMFVEMVLVPQIRRANKKTA